MRVCGCVIALLCSCFVLLAVAQVTNPSEVNALRAVKSSLSDPRKHLKNWNNGDPCKSHWNGVFCNNTVGADGYLHLEELRLLNMNLSGSLAPELGQLSHLLILLLSGNKLSGSLPDELGYLSKLDRLQVDQNYMSGPIPKSFVNLVNVKHLLFDSNNLSGYLPPEFSNLPNLRIIQFDNNNFRGTEIPASYGNISKLVKISLRNCSLQGEIPDFSRIRSLHYLDLSWNQLSGSIPSYRLSPNMTTIDLSDNQLSGSIPESFSDLPSLQKLSLENNLLTGSVPAILWNISFSTRARLKLDLRNNSLSNISGELNPPANVTLRLSAVIVEPRRMGIRKEILAAIITGAVASSVILSTTVMLLITRCLRHRDRPPSRRLSSSKITVKIDGVKAFTFKEMTLATRNFDSSTQLGRGGYGKVYRGILSDDTVVAIKRAEQGSLQGEKEFLTEIELLSRLHHRNLVSLVDIVMKKGSRYEMLVYEFMPNGTLRDWLCVKAKGSLSFGMRLQIALGSAKGILYLHNEAILPYSTETLKPPTYFWTPTLWLK
ncbi:putative LRR receptor-like serine/threonine-protein kinase [Prunus yedoensis var. nudiflora]|uniref:non-specific serine/threonine protein kinase n=1 Tax=Prunus yedoensis var. nudiflora TaxID=2094558 RepID=A0A314YX40_PRUYE|nr:putative LRR receptor-like serine/threonine-protein kinase [Prunus yedoensis var. nudiflora]